MQSKTYLHRAFKRLSLFWSDMACLPEREFRLEGLVAVGEVEARHIHPRRG
jgi:hypothetical protein